MTDPKHPIQATPMIRKVLPTTDIVQIIPTAKIISTTTLTSIESTTKVPQTTTQLEIKTVDTVHSTPAITTGPTSSTTSSIPTTLATTTDISTTEATVNKGRKRILTKIPMKKVNIFKGKISKSSNFIFTQKRTIRATTQQFMIPFLMK